MNKRARALAVVGSLTLALSWACGGGTFEATPGDSDQTSSSGGSSSSSSSGGASSSGGSSGGASSSSSSSSSGGASSSGSAPECEGSCRETQLVLSLGAASVTLDRSQFGFDANGGGVYVEAHVGGEPACPTQNSPSPDTTVVLTFAEPSSVSETFSLGAGLTAALLDFKGDISPDPMPPKAQRAELTVRYVGERDGQREFAYELDAEFAGGITLRGHAFAAHCGSMDE